MKLSVTSFRAHSSAQKKILNNQNQLNYVTTHLPVVPSINSASDSVSFRFHHSINLNQSLLCCTILLNRSCGVKVCSRFFFICEIVFYFHTSTKYWFKSRKNTIKRDPISYGQRILFYIKFRDLYYLIMASRFIFRTKWYEEWWKKGSF